MDRDRLPNGERFVSWEKPRIWRKSYHVAQTEAASDDNPGTEEAPFRTIGRAAQVLEPGERVLIGTGVYRECVRPTRGGTGPNALIGYEAAPGARVVVTGTEVWETDWRLSTGWNLVDNVDYGDLPPIQEDAVVWHGRLPRGVFEESNPFGMHNMNKNARQRRNLRRSIERFDPPDLWMRRGMLFVDGEPLKQVINQPELHRRPGTWWVEDDGMNVHFRLADDGDPRDHALEFTAREQVFAPDEMLLGYILVKGLTLEKAGNGYPVPQRGALSTHSGHHWIIEGNTIRWANTLGMDIGFQSWYRQVDGICGYHIVRDNHITDCGQCGIAGTVGSKVRGVNALLVEGNLIERTGWHPIEPLFESAGIKFHICLNCMVRDNVILDTQYGSGIWLDVGNTNTRVTGNVIVGIKSTLFGGFFLEGSHHADQIDNNLIYGVGADKTSGKGGHGIYEHDSDYMLIQHNVVGACEGSAVYLNLGQVDRLIEGRGSTGRKHRLLNNLLADAGWLIEMPTPDNFTDGNLLGSHREDGYIRIQHPREYLDLEAARAFHGWEQQGELVEADLDVDVEAMTLRVRIVREGHTIDQSFDLKQPLDFSGLFAE